MNATAKDRPLLRYIFRDVRHDALRTADARTITIEAVCYADAEKHLFMRYESPEQFTYCGTLPVSR